MSLDLVWIVRGAWWRHYTLSDSADIPSDYRL